MPRCDGLEPAAQPRLHIFLATSDLHLKHKLRISRGEALAQIVRWCRFGARTATKWNFPPKMPAARTSISCAKALAAAADAGANVINLPDTVGYTTPEEYGEMFRACAQHLGGLSQTSCSARIATTIWVWRWPIHWRRWRAGARQVECTINGIGERAGNASLEEIAVALHSAQEPLRGCHRISLSRRFSHQPHAHRNHRLPVPPNKAVVGANAFAHEAGIHQDGIMKNPLTYEIISPETVGVPARPLVLGKHSGRNAV